MTKKAVTFMLAMAFLLTTTGVSIAKFSCTVESIEGDKLVLNDCQEKGLKRLKTGSEVDISKKRKKLEGC